jgi:hypothetical protein
MNALPAKRNAGATHAAGKGLDMTVYVIAQLKMTDRTAYDRYQARFFDVFKKFSGRLLSADENPEVMEGAWGSRQAGIDVVSRRGCLSRLRGLAGVSGHLAGSQSGHGGHRAAGEGICAARLGRQSVARGRMNGNPLPLPLGEGWGEGLGSIVRS